MGLQTPTRRFLPAQADAPLDAIFTFSPRAWTDATHAPLCAAVQIANRSTHHVIQALDVLQRQGVLDRTLEEWRAAAERLRAGAAILDFAIERAERLGAASRPHSDG